MATADLNTALHYLSGAVDGFVYKHYCGKLVITRVPRMNRVKPTPAQLAQRERFREAARFHQSVLADPVLKNQFAERAREERLPLSAVTMADFLRRKPKDESSGREETL